MEGYSDTWCKAIGNELGGLDNGIDNRVRATNTIRFLIKGRITKRSHGHIC